MPKRTSKASSNAYTYHTVWRELKAAGWTYKKPPRSSLDDCLKYVPSGGTPDGRDGVDFFLGADALMEHYAQVLRARVHAQADAVLDAAAQIAQADSYDACCLSRSFHSACCLSSATYETVPSVYSPRTSSKREFSGAKHAEAVACDRKAASGGCGCDISP
ncbi:hypothetical protein PRNP1_006655 [Phytophthora ramorum]